MRLWHVDLIPYLPTAQLLGQHRECCALRGKGWGKPHKDVNYVFQYDPVFLFWYHLYVMGEMKLRQYNFDSIWLNRRYRGVQLGYEENFCGSVLYANKYPEHNEAYKQECIQNLRDKRNTKIEENRQMNFDEVPLNKRKYNNNNKQIIELTRFLEAVE